MWRLVWEGEAREEWGGVCGTWQQSSRRIVILQNSNEKVWAAEGVTVLAVAQM